MAAICDILQAKITQPLMTRYCQRRAWRDQLRHCSEHPPTCASELPFHAP